MTIKEAIERRIKKVRLPVWAEGAHLELPIFDKGIGPVAIVRDPNAGDAKIGMWHFDDDNSTDWEPYEGAGTT